MLLVYSEIQIFNFGYPSSGHCIYVSNYVRIPGYFLKPKWARVQKNMGNIDITDLL